jgi:hypothetical protein
MTAVRFYIAQYVSDPLRQEPRNVGVFAAHGSRITAKFYGEAASGAPDGRKLRGFPRPDVYRQWVEYWRSLTQRTLEDFEKGLTEGLRANYRVIEGGEVSNTEEDSLPDVANYLYSMLVSDGGLSEAMGSLDVEDEATDGPLKSILAEEFTAANIFARSNEENGLVPHPIRERVEVKSRFAEPHIPSFTQQNGLLYVMETIDFTSSAKERAKQHAGLASFMFEDIDHVYGDASQSIAIVRARDEDKEFASVRYALSILESESKQMVNWLDLKQRSAFLADRQRIAFQPQ